ncbi:SH3 domain-containing protein [Sphingobacterium sp. N143]|uniref:SH3 domain-containing protein n=1 Tax=Sphingobacterium sp. N143 TaxID=2746727 RepID=UPI0025773B91|nr:SH3 domain-containing protein [Sphingobacterium sp. N143]MDM1296121.1 SH3 domain-containing protein [Sphingobacterium sp. N143]
MKRLLFLPLCMLVGGTISIGMSGCAEGAKKRGVQKEDSIQNNLTASKDTAEKFPPLPINYDQTKVLKNLYVTDRAGVVLRQGADESAPALGKYPYGTKLDIIAEEGEWIAVMDRIQRDYKGADGETNDVTQWEKVYVEKSKIGSHDKITISPKDLNLIVSQHVKGQERYYERGHQLDEYLHLELISEQDFIQARKTAEDCLIRDTLSYPKHDHVLELPLVNGKKLIFKDKKTDSDDEAEFNYIGHCDALNAFAIAGNYWESGDVRLFDRHDGQLIVACKDYPYLSPDKNYLMTLHADPYESTGDLTIFHVKQDKISQMIFLSFRQWMPSVDTHLIFWGKDGHIYAAVNHKDAYWDENGSLKEKHQYIRITILKSLVKTV